MLKQNYKQIRSNQIASGKLFLQDTNYLEQEKSSQSRYVLYSQYRLDSFHTARNLYCIAYSYPLNFISFLGSFL